MVVQRRPRGALEGQVMRLLWDAARPLTAREVVGLMPEPRPAHTTILTALDRLAAKGQVRRTGTRDIQFEAASSEEEHVGHAMLERLLASRDPEGVLRHFTGGLDADGLAALRRAVGSPDGQA
ncbi:BlaI/MecI/CopY family transcriptional regulator [Nocardioides zeae]|uniref:BlaI/MecI/CopY family transcriptional regulator n=1 Tax=Nocardioides imazamoxiresistens TaxID=3231893 RepID=A0ABU3PTH6_9ACTN|nr:BlaI/MecI/CopY family transcriptional regulator [Nocardioides zeae]MDT9592533.1 BlaI/MecI/CopY family transcriptional regulator [Nocardioides zeae]